MSAGIESLVERRARLLGPNNTLFYDDPVHLVRGEGVWLHGADGKRYLDCYNNVPCVGHCHARIVETLCRQASTLNTHTRYLNENILDYAELLLSKFDDALDRIALACTGSEANELALRIARFNTGGDGFICTNASYHGNTAAVAQLSSPAGSLGVCDDNIRRVSWPDTYRVRNGLRGKALSDAYADEVESAIQSFADSGVRFAGLIACPIFANEGLPEVLDGYLRKIVGSVRAAGGVFIADEVQAGFGRTGGWWGHALSGVVPDIITLGKSMGAGYPISGVVARGELLDNFRRSEGYFNTYGGNPVSCAVARAVIEVIDDERLLENVAGVGGLVLKGVEELQSKYEIIGDVRGLGLFFAIELVKNRTTKEPATAAARTIVNRMRQNGILISRIGEHDNILKLRPPLCFSKDNADFLLSALGGVLSTL